MLLNSQAVPNQSCSIKPVKRLYLRLTGAFLNYSDEIYDPFYFLYDFSGCFNSCILLQKHFYHGIALAVSGSSPKFKRLMAGNAVMSPPQSCQCLDRLIDFFRAGPALLQWCTPPVVLSPMLNARGSPSS